MRLITLLALVLSPFSVAHALVAQKPSRNAAATGALGTGAPLAPEGTCSGHLTDAHPAGLLPGSADLLGTGFRAGAHDVALGDLDGDGILDRAVAERNETRVSVRLGNGNGTFRPGGSVGTQASPFWVALGDLDLDGALDLAVSNQNGSALQIRMGNGDGTFGGATELATQGARPREVELVDVDLDSVLDVVLAVAFEDTVRIYLGVGDGSFAPRLTHPTGAQPERVAVGDLNGDAFPDVVATSGIGRSFDVLLNQQDGSLGPPATTSIGWSVEDAAIGDLDGDGDPEVVVVDSVDRLHVFPGNGDGTLGTPQILQVDDGASVEIADLDLDGDQDVIVSTADGTSGRSDDGVFLKNRGDGTFDVSSFEVGDEAQAVAVGDLDGDGTPDLSFATSIGRTVTSFLNDAQGGFHTGYDLATSSFPSQVLTADLGDHGHMDLLAATTTAVQVFQGRGDGTFGAPVSYGLGFQIHAALGDLTQDDVDDLVVTRDVGSSEGVDVYPGLGDGTFGARIATSFADPMWLATGRFDADELEDVLVLRRTTGNTTELFLLSGTGTGNFAPEVTTGIAGNLLALAVGDLDGDGRADVAAADRFLDSVEVFLGQGNGAFVSSGTTAVGQAPIFAALGDLDGDELLDLALALSGEETVEVLAGDGAGGFSSSTRYAVDEGPVSVSAADADGDGRLDLLVGHDTPSLALLFGQCDGTLAPAVYFQAGDRSTGAAVADFDEDGAPDVAVAVAQRSRVTILPNQSFRRPRTTAEPIPLAPAPAVRAPAPGPPSRAPRGARR